MLDSDLVTRARKNRFTAVFDSMAEGTIILENVLTFIDLEEAHANIRPQFHGFWDMQRKRAAKLAAKLDDC